MRKVYSLEVKVVATAYVIADSPGEAKLKLAEAIGKDPSCFTDDPAGGLPISGLSYDDPRLPAISLSPAMTVCGVLDDQEVATLVESDDRLMDGRE